MPQSYINLLYHIVFSTKDRQPLITDTYQTRLYEYIGGIIRGQGGITLAINGTADHVHLLAKLRQDHALSGMIRDFKTKASGWMHQVFPEVRDFAYGRDTELLRSALHRWSECGDTLLISRCIIESIHLEMSS